MRVVIVDDHPLFRLGARQALTVNGEFRVIGEAGTAAEAFVLLDKETPEVVLMDIGLPGMDGVTATREINRRSPTPRVLIMSLHDQLRDLLDALNAGASGYILKSEGAEALVQAVRTVARGERYLAPAVAGRIAPYEGRPNRPADVLCVLSGREREVFRMAADCLTTGEIARELVISRKTVDTHLYRIHHKLGLRTSAELVRLGSTLAGRMPPQSAPPHDRAPVAPIMDHEGVNLRQLEQRKAATP
jgi:DNA-binding NarL/FixJ family response regulator